MDRPPELHKLLSQFADDFDNWLPMDAPTESSDLVLDLEGSPDTKDIPFAVVCRYYEHFQSGLLELTKGVGKKQGSSRVLALRATAYAVPEITVTPRRGAGPIVRLQLTQPHFGQIDLQDHTDEPERTVVGAIGNAARVLRWAGSGAPLNEAKALSPTPKERMDVAFQAMKMLPSAPIASVRIGGRLLGITESVELKPNHAGQLLSIIQEEQAPVDFTETGAVRALDLDQGWFRIKSETAGTKCWIKERKDLLDKAGAALASHLKVHVSGMMFRVRSRRLVVVDNIDLV